MDITIIMATIKNSMVNTLKLQITYRKIDGTESMRTVEPYEIKSGGLFAFDGEMKGDKPRIKNFKLSNIVSAVVTDEKFEPRWPIQ